MDEIIDWYRLSRVIWNENNELNWKENWNENFRIQNINIDKLNENLNSNNWIYVKELCFFPRYWYNHEQKGMECFELLFFCFFSVFLSWSWNLDTFRISHFNAYISSPVFILFTYPNINFLIIASHINSTLNI